MHSIRSIRICSLQTLRCSAAAFPEEILKAEGVERHPMLNSVKLLEWWYPGSSKQFLLVDNEVAFVVCCLFTVQLTR